MGILRELSYTEKGNSYSGKNETVTENTMEVHNDGDKM